MTEAIFGSENRCEVLRVRAIGAGAGVGAGTGANTGAGLGSGADGREQLPFAHEEIGVDVDVDSDFAFPNF